MGLPRGRGKLRVIAGKLRGRRLATLDGSSVRPTSDRARGALFDILGAGVAGARFLDLCAGSGSVGIEAWSRGAAEVALIESDRLAADLVRQNLDTVGVPWAARPGQSSVIVLACELREGLAQLARAGWASEIAFADPPYGGGALDRALRLLAASGVLSPGAVVIAEHDSSEEPPEPRGLTLVRNTRYGRTGLTFFRAPG